MAPCSSDVLASVKRITVSLALSLLLTSWAFAADPLEIGVPIPVTGPYAADGKVMERGIRLAIDQLNSEGGVLGRPLTARVFDIGDLTPDKLQAAASELIDRRNVAVLINGYGGMGPDIPAFCPHAQPYLNNNATTPVVDLAEKMGCKNIFMASDVDQSYGRQLFEQMLHMGYDFPGKRIAILHGPYDWEVGSTEGIRQAAEAAGWQVTLNEEVPYGTTQWAGAFAKLRAGKPDLVIVEILDPAPLSTFLDQMRKAPLKGSILYAGYTLSTPAMTGLVAKGGLDGLLGMTLSAQQPNAKGDAFVAKWRAAYGEDPPFSIASQVYDEVMLWADAVKRAGTATDYPAVIKALGTSDFVGLTGTIKFNSRFYVTAGDATQPPQLLQAQGGKMKALMIGSRKAADFVKPVWLN
jgi:branched-chain amino acid transport system substrate-binding protein